MGEIAFLILVQGISYVVACAFFSMFVGLGPYTRARGLEKTHLNLLSPVILEIWDVQLFSLNDGSDSAIYSLVKGVIWVLMVDQFFYATHRLMHTKWLYKYHAIHHEWRHDTHFLATFHAHLVDYWLTNLLPVVLPLLIIRASLPFAVVATAVATFNSVWSHSIKGHHITHHIRVNKNFGLDLFSDRMYGTKA